MTTTLLGLLLSISSLTNRLAPAGTQLHIRLTSTVGSYASTAGSPVSAVLIAPALGGGETILPAGSTLSGTTLSTSCTRRLLIVEADGGQHADKESDRRRTAWLESEGGRVLRFWNNDALANTDGVVETILRELLVR